MELQGKSAIVTGAGGAGPGGLGVVYAEALAREGASVTVADVDGDAAAAVAARLVAAGHQAIGVGADVADEAAVIAMVDAAVTAFGGVDILVNNAGLARGKWGLGIELSTEDWIQILAVNTVAPLTCARACRASMIERGGGVIVNQTSSAAFGEAGAYSVSKLALVGITNMLSAELAVDNIRVNAIAPGMMTAQIPQEQVQEILRSQKIARQGTPQDLVGALLYLCSDRSSFVTGFTMRVDGGTVRGRV